MGEGQRKPILYRADYCCLFISKDLLHTLFLHLMKDRQLISILINVNSGCCSRNCQQDVLSTAIFSTALFCSNVTLMAGEELL
jgi:hypothetical protein